MITAAAPEAVKVLARTAEIETTVAEFVGWVTLLAEAAGILTEQTETVAPLLTFDEAVGLLDVCRESVRSVETTGDGLSRQIAALWSAGRDAVLNVDGALVDVPVDVKHAKDRRHWDHDGLMRAVIGRHLEQAQAEGRTPDPYEVGGWVIAAALPSYWRLQILADLGIDPEPYCRRRDLIPEVELRKPAPAADDPTRRATPARDIPEGDNP